MTRVIETNREGKVRKSKLANIIHNDWFTDVHRLYDITEFKSRGGTEELHSVGKEKIENWFEKNLDLQCYAVSGIYTEEGIQVSHDHSSYLVDLDHENIKINFEPNNIEFDDLPETEKLPHPRDPWIINTVYHERFGFHETGEDVIVTLFERDWDKRIIFSEQEDGEYTVRKEVGELQKTVKLAEDFWELEFKPEKVEQEARLHSYRRAKQLFYNFIKIYEPYGLDRWLDTY